MNKEPKTFKERLSDITKTLDEKGYQVELFTIDTNIKSTIIMLNDIIKDLKLKNAFSCEDTEIRNSIFKFCQGKILIIFKEDHNFKILPENFTKLNNHLFYRIPFEECLLSEKKDPEIISILDTLIDEALNKLKEWSNNLPL